MKKQPQFRVVPLSEIHTCHCQRLDQQHYIPIHRTWEYKHKDKLGTKNALITACLKNKISPNQFQLAQQHVK